MGRTATHVANRYGYTIYARCDAVRQRLVGFSNSSGMGASFGGSGFNCSSSNSAKFDVNIIKADIALLMGRSATHVANRYGYTIYARCDAERQRLVASNSAKVDVNIINAGFTKILPGNFVKFEVDCRGTKTVYISIYTIVNNSVENICENLPKRRDYSVIVEQSGQVVDAKYGTIWTRKSRRTFSCKLCG